MPSHPSTREKLYFATADAAKREKLRADLDAAAKKLRDAGALGTDDGALVERIQALGFTGDSARVFDLLPLIHVSWADGRVQRAERAVILELCEARGMKTGSPAFVLVESLLEERPSDDFLEETLRLLRELAASRGDGAPEVIDLCLRVADASGGLLGIGSRIAEAERELMRQVAEALGETAQSRFRERLSN